MTVAIFVQNSAYYDQRVGKQIQVFKEMGLEIILFAILTDRDNGSRIISDDRITIKFGLYRRNAGIIARLGWFVNALKHKLSRIAINRRFVVDFFDTHFCGPCTSIFMKSAKGFRFDLAYANDLNTVPAVLRISRERGIPFIYDAHELYSEEATDISPLEKQAILRMEKKATEGSVLNITVSNAIASKLVSLHSLNVKPRVIRNVPILNLEVTPPTVQLNQPAKLIYHTANLNLMGRNLKDLVDAVSLVKDDFELTLIGNMSDVDETILRDYIAKKGLANRTQIFPAMPFAQLLPFISEFDIGFILNHPSLANTNLTIPNKLFEYMACGVAIVSFSTAEVGPIVQKNRIGCLAATPDTLGLKEAIETLLRDSKLLLESKLNSRRAFEAQYTWSAEREAFRNYLLQAPQISRLLEKVC